MPLIIDGHNLIPNISGLNLTIIDDEMQLIQILLKYQKKNRGKIDVFFDNAPPGQPRTRRFGSVTAHFIGQESTLLLKVEFIMLIE